LTVETRRKSSKKILTGYKFVIKKNFCTAIFFFTAIFVEDEQFLQNCTPSSNRPLYTNACCQKSEGVLARLFLATRPTKCQVRVFPKLLRKKYNQYYLRTAALQYGPPLSPSWAGRLGEL
jgi:hypothetical protein